MILFNLFNLFNLQSNMVRRLAQSVLHQRPHRPYRTATPLPDRWCNDFVIQFCLFPKKTALQFIDVRESSAIRFLLQITSLYISRCRKMCEVASFKNFENSLTTVKGVTKTKVAPFYLRHGVYVTSFIFLPIFVFKSIRKW